MQQQLQKLYFCYCTTTTTKQWLFHKTGTMGKLARRAEIGVWAQALEALAEVRGYYPRKEIDCIRKILQFSAFYPENGSQCRP